jgi:4-hydroxy-tetrahydrodipicolinate synthase
MMPAKEFSGIFPYLVTPVDESGDLKDDVLRDLVNHLISTGVHGLTPLGSTGEGAYLDWPMKQRVVKVVVEAAAGRVPVVAGVNNMTTHGAVREAVETERIGVDGVLVVLPSYFPVNDQRQVVAHFQSVARAVSCPVVLYTNPKFAMWDFTVEALRQLAEEANIRYLKDASGNIGKLMSIVTELGDRFKIFSATAHVPVFVLMLGGVGWMAGPACLIPEQSIALYELARQKRWEALALQKKLWPLNVAFQRYSLAACVKAGLEMHGFPVGPPLPPQQQLDEEGKRVVSQILTTIGVL